jgi:hypothetical protein
MARTIPSPAGEFSEGPVSVVDILNDFIKELYEDGTVDRWKREQARGRESKRGRRRGEDSRERGG